MDTPTAADIEAIERTTLAAVPPQALEEEGGWLLALDDGPVGRAHSAVPLRHEAPHRETVALIERRYRAGGLTPMLRLPRIDCYEALRQELVQAGWSSSSPTLTQTGSIEALTQLAPVSQAPGVLLGTRPDDAWAAAFLGTSFDPVDGAGRLAILQRSRQAVFASVRIGSEVVAVGAGCYSQGWLGVHGMRTLPAWRRQGHAAQLLSELGREGTRRSIAHVFLQVEEPNTGAQALYARAGFTTAWAYDYWQPA